MNIVSEYKERVQVPVAIRPGLATDEEDVFPSIFTVLILV